MFFAVSIQTILSQDTTSSNNSNDSVITAKNEGSYKITDRSKIFNSLNKKYSRTDFNFLDDKLSMRNTKLNTGLFEKKYRRWKILDMGIETGCGILFGLGGAFAGGAIGSLFHAHGDTSNADSKLTYTAVMIGLSIGHIIGTVPGVVYGGLSRKVEGSVLWALVGGVGAEVPALIMFIKKRTVFSILFLAIVPSVVSTIGFNIADD